MHARDREDEIPRVDEAVSLTRMGAFPVCGYIIVVREEVEDEITRVDEAVSSEEFVIY